MLNIFMKGSLMTLRHEKIQHRPGGKKKKKMEIEFKWEYAFLGKSVF